MTDSNQTAFRCSAVVVGAVDAEPNLIGAFGRTLFEPSDLEVMDSLRSQFFSEETRVPSIAATLAGEKQPLRNNTFKYHLRGIGQIGCDLAY